MGLYPYTRDAKLVNIGLETRLTSMVEKPMCQQCVPYELFWRLVGLRETSVALIRMNLIGILGSSESGKRLSTIAKLQELIASHRGSR